MYWYRAKTYLLIALLSVNILFAISIICEIHHTRPSQEISHDMKKSFDSYLAQKHIILESEPKEWKQPLSPLEISYPPINKSTYPKLFEDFSDYLSIKQNKQLALYIPMAMIIKPDTDFYEYTLSFINSYFPNENLELKYSKNENSHSYYYFTPLYEGKPLEEAFLSFDFDQEKHNLTIQKINILAHKSTYTARRLSSPLKAIAQAAPEMKAGTVIINVEPVYYYKPDENSDLLLTETARALPSWRIETKEHEFFYIPAFY